MGREKITETLETHLNKWDMEIVEAYLDAKEAYLNTPSADTSAAMHYAFQNAFFTIKQPMVRGEISRQQFDDLIELIQD